MDKLVNSFMHNKIILYIATLLSFLTPSKVNRLLFITSSYILVLKIYDVMHNIQKETFLSLF